MNSKSSLGHHSGLLRNRLGNTLLVRNKIDGVTYGNGKVQCKNVPKLAWYLLS